MEIDWGERVGTLSLVAVDIMWEGGGCLGVRWGEFGRVRVSRSTMETEGEVRWIIKRDILGS